MMGRTTLMVHFVIFLLLLLPSLAFAKASPSDVSRLLIEQFTEQTGRHDFQAPISRKKYVGFETETIRFALGPKTYRIVFSEDGRVTVSRMLDGDISFQPIWKANAKNVSVEDIVNVIFSQEFGRNFDTTLARKKKSEIEKDDAAKISEENFSKAGNALRWNHLMNQILKGDPGGKLAGGLGPSAGLAKMMDPCNGNRAGASPQRAAMTQIAMAMAMAMPHKGSLGNASSDLLYDRSRKYSKKTDYSLLEDLENYGEGPNPDGAFQLLKQNQTATLELFQAAVRQSEDVLGKVVDPYLVAAQRNFRQVGRNSSDDKMFALVDRVMKKTVVDVTTFAQLRALNPESSVIYDAKKDRFFMDPTLNSPVEARYLLSLGVLYAWRLGQKDAQKLLKEYRAVHDEISRLEFGSLSPRNQKHLHEKRKEALTLSKRLVQLTQALSRMEAHPER